MPAGLELPSFHQALAANGVNPFLSFDFAADTYQTAGRYNWNSFHPLLLPDVGSLVQLLNRRLLGRDRTGSVYHALSMHGVNMGQVQGGDYDGMLRDVWFGSRELAKDVPSAGMVMDAARRGIIGDEEAINRLRRAGADTGLMLQTLSWGREPASIGQIIDARRRNLIQPAEATKRLLRAGGDPSLLLPVAEWQRDRPGVGDVNDAYIRDRITDVEWSNMLTSAGSDITLWRDFLSYRYSIMSAGELIVCVRRQLIDESDLERWLKRNGIRDAEMLTAYKGLLREPPGVADLLRMSVRQLFSPEIVADYGLYDEFPESIRPWFRNLGLDYPIALNMPAAQGGRRLTLPEMYWGMTREILPLNAAYIAYQRLRPDRLDRFRAEVPGIRPFELRDLQYHMRVAGYPPPMRDFLVALSHPPLGRRDIQQGVRYLGWNVAQTKPYYLDLGFSQEDAQTLAELQVAREEQRVDSWKESITHRAHVSTVSEIEGLYDEGIIDRGQALLHLSAAGLSGELSTQLLDLSDSRRSRGLLRAAVSATGRDYLSGVLSTAETVSALAGLGIQSQRAGELMQVWAVRRSRRRRQADTGRILRWVGQGRLTAEDGRRRLGNLGWTDPDLMLLTAEAEANLDKLHQREQKLRDTEATRRAKEIHRLEKEAESERKRLRSEANRVAPRSVLLGWLRDGVIDEPTFRDLMSSRGYPKEEVDRYVSDLTKPRPPRPKVVPAASAFPKPEGSAHPALGLVEKMYLTEVISLEQFDTSLKEMGYGDEDRRRIIAIADLKHGAKGTTREPPSPAPPT